MSKCQLQNQVLKCFIPPAWFPSLKFFVCALFSFSYKFKGFKKSLLNWVVEVNFHQVALTYVTVLTANYFKL